MGNEELEKYKVYKETTRKKDDERAHLIYMMYSTSQVSCYERQWAGEGTRDFQNKLVGRHEWLSSEICPRAV